MHYLKTVLLVLTVFCFTNCAKKYTHVNPPYQFYSSLSSDKNVAFQYKYNVLNKKYTRRELRSYVRLASVKIVNNSGKDLVFGTDINVVKSDGSDVQVLDNITLHKVLKQKVAPYVAYILLSPLYLDLNGKVVPIGLAVGPGLVAGNIGLSAKANKDFKRELMHYNLMNKTIKDGETAYGIIGLMAPNYDALSIKVN